MRLFANKHVVQFPLSPAALVKTTEKLCCFSKGICWKAMFQVRTKTQWSNTLSWPEEEIQMFVKT